MNLLPSFLYAIILGGFFTFARVCEADVILSGVLQHGTQPGLHGRTGGSPIWNTLGNEVSFANIYITRPNEGYTAPFLNSGNGADASVQLTLGVGEYDFYYFMMGFWDNNLGEYGLNLFFDGDTSKPGIAAYTVAGTASANSATAGMITLALDGSATAMTPTPSDLTFTSGNLNVVLTSYGYGLPGDFGGPALDRVGNLNSLPDRYTDSVGFFSLSVFVVPEPTSLALLGLGLLSLFSARSHLPRVAIPTNR